MKKITLFFTLLAVSFGFAQGSPDCATAEVAVAGGSYTGDIVGNDVTGDGDDTWYTYTASTTSIAEISVCADINDPDTIVAVFTDGCGTLTPVANDDDGCAGTFESFLTFSVTMGTTYLIQWSDDWSEAPFDWTLNEVPPVANDECTGAIAMICDDVVNGDTGMGATDSGGNAAPDLWYSYTTTLLEDVTVSLCGSGYDTAIRVYSDCPATNQVLFNDDFCGLQSEGTFTADGTGGAATYYIMVEGFGGNSGPFTLTLTCAPNVPAPPNDLCSNAIALTIDTPLTGQTTAGATDDSTGNTDDTTCDSFVFHSDVWYTFVAPDADVSITTTITGTSDQANVAVYSSTDCSQLDADSIACSAGNGGETAVPVTGLIMNNTYYVRVWSDGVVPEAPQRAEGTFDIVVNNALLGTESFDINGFEYFPNPVNDKLTLRSLSNIQNIAVYNMLGQEVMKLNPDAVDAEVDMNSLSQGAYFVKVTINDVSDTIRIIKR